MTELTPEACRAARAILKWTVREMADHAELDYAAVHRFETTGRGSETLKAALKSCFAAHHVEIIDDNGTGAKLLRSGQRPVGGQSEPVAASVPPPSWQPVRDARGQVVPLTYDFIFTDERETVIGQWREEDEAEPVSVAWLKEEVTGLARKVIAAHPSERPWDGWRVSVMATGLTTQPDEVVSFLLGDLLGPF